MSIIDSLPDHWRTTIKDSWSFPNISPVLDAPTIIIDGNSLTLSGVSSKQIYRQFQGKKQVLPTAQKKLSDKYRLCHRLGEGLFSILQIVYGIKTKRISVQNFKLYRFHKQKTLSFWYYAITTIDLLPKRRRIHQASTLFL